MVQSCTRFRGLRLVVSGVILTGILATPGVALAVSSTNSAALVPTTTIHSSRTPRSAPPAQPIASGAYGNVMTIKTVSPYGGTVTGTGPSGTVYTLTVPTGAFRVPQTIVLLSPSLSHQPGDINAQVSIAVMQNGMPVAVPFLKQMSLEIDGPNVNTSSFVNEVTLTGQEIAVNNAQLSSNMDPYNEVALLPVMSNGQYIDTYVVLTAFPPPSPKPPKPQSITLDVEEILAAILIIISCGFGLFIWMAEPA